VEGTIGRRGPCVILGNGKIEGAEKRRHNREYNWGRRGRELKYKLGI
jgi:hypothetical protein